MYMFLLQGGFVTLIECCRFEGFYNGHCEVMNEDKLL